MAKEKQEQYDKKKKKGDNLGKFLYHEKIRKFHPSQSGRNYRDRFFSFLLCNHQISSHGRDVC